MAYCKYCGIDSKDSVNCEWCKRPLPPVPTAPAVPPPPTIPEDRLGKIEQEGRKALGAFFTFSGTLIVLGACLILWRYQLYPSVTIASLFVTGILLAHFDIIPTFEDDWADIGIPLLFLLFFPAWLVFLGYLGYGLATRQMNLTVVWLLGTYFGALLVLQLVTIAVIPDRISTATWLKFRATEFLGLCAIFFGWVSSSWFRPLNR